MTSKFLIAFFPLLLGAALHVQAQTAVTVRALGSGEPTPAFHFKCAGESCKGAVIVTPTCAGLRDVEGGLHPYYVNLGTAMSARGQVLVVDHFSARGGNEDCPKAGGHKRVSEQTRADDVLGAYQYLVETLKADPAMVFHVGFGGASPILSIQKSSLARLQGLPGLAGAIAFYPVCNEIPVRSYDAISPLLILHGESDNWNPVRWCQSIASRQSDRPEQGRVTLITYPDTNHAFNFPTPERTYPGTNFTVGGNKTAATDAFARSRAFMTEIMMSKTAVGLPK